MKLRSKMPSGALQFSVFVSAVIALLLIAFLLLVHTQQKISLRSKKDIEIINTTKEAFRYLQNKNRIPIDTFALDIIKAPGISVKAHVSAWGIFQKAYVQSTYDTHQYSKCGLLGGGIQRTNRKAIVLKENYKPLLLVANTKITGDVVLSEQGVRSGVIKGHTFYGNQLINGRIGKSKLTLPKLQPQIIHAIHQYFVQFPERSENFLLESNHQVWKQSFAAPTQWIYDSGVIYLNENKLKGNIIIRSEKKIIVSPQARLQDVLLIAPEIVIQDRVSGAFQAIATQSIYVGEQCQLNYPSALVLVQKNKAKKKKSAVNHKQSVDDAIVIDQSSIVKGAVCYLNAGTPMGYSNNITFKDKSKLIGEIYCQGNLELNNEVIGSVYTNQFSLNHYGSIYMNHLYNVTINSQKLPNNFAGISFDTTSKKIAKWLY